MSFIVSFSFGQFALLIHISSRLLGPPFSIHLGVPIFEFTCVSIFDCTHRPKVARQTKKQSSAS